MNKNLDTIIELIRQAVNEDWIEDFEITADTTFNNDLELESIELVVIAEKIQQHFGKSIDFNQWLGGLDFDEMISLNVGQLVTFVEEQIGET